MVKRYKEININVPKVEELNYESIESFSDMFAVESEKISAMQGAVVKGIVVDFTDEVVIIDAGLKSEGRIERREFGSDDLKKGDIIDIYVERYETRDGYAILSREQARREEVWTKLESLQNEGKTVEGKILERVKGGFSVDVDGVLGFMPGSQVDVRPIRDLNDLIGETKEVIILKMDKERANVIVSHRAILEGEMSKKREEIMKTIKVGDVLDGVIKNITEYGVFIDLGGVDGLLHITDISWKRISDPHSILSVGQNIKTKVISYDAESQRISLGMKQLEKDPWDSLSEELKVGEVYKGTVNNVMDYGAFIELDNNIEGLVHNSEISWTNKNIHPGKVLSVGDKIDVMLLDIDREKRRLSLSVKQCAQNPWQEFGNTHSAGDVIEGEIKNITEFGLFVDMGNDLNGMVHLSDLSWDISGDEAVKDYAKGQTIKAKIVDISTDKERIVLGVKQLEKDVVGDNIARVSKGDVVTCEVKEIKADELIVEYAGAEGSIKAIDLSKERSEQKTDRFAVGDRIDAKIKTLNAKTRALTLSVKSLEIEEEKKAIKEYGSSETGAVLGDILGVAMEEAKDKKDKK